MKLKLLLTTAILAGSIHPSSAVTIGGIDPATAPIGLTDGGATNFTVIGNLVTTTGATGFDVDLAASTFTYQSNATASASALPFLAVQSGGIHALGSYDVLWMGAPLTNAAATVDVSAPLGVGTFSLPANSTIVAGYWSDTTRSPVSYTDNSGSGDDTLILAGTTTSVANDLVLNGTDWSANAGVADRDYHYQVDLQEAIPEPSSGILLGLSGVALLLRRRRR